MVRISWRRLGRLSLAITLGVLASCTQTPRDIPIKDLDLNNPQLVAKLVSRLPAEQKAAFLTYSVAHWPGSKKYCGVPLNDENGQQPATLGEAIDRTLKREAEIRRFVLTPPPPPTPQEQSRQQRQMLVDQMETLIQEQDRLRSQMGSAANRDRRYRATDRELALVREQLATYQ